MRQTNWALGLSAGVIAFTFWGAVIPELYYIYSDLPSAKLLAYFGVFGTPLMWILLFSLGKWNEFKNLMHSPQKLILSFMGALGQMVSMVAFIIGIATNQGLAVSLSYFVLPLCYVVIGALFFKEKLSPLMAGALAIAVLSLIFLFVRDGQISWVLPVICLGASLYSTMRKITDLEPISGLTWELSSLTPFAIIYLLFFASSGALPHSGHEWGGYILIAWANLVPLLALVICIQYLPFHLVGVMAWIAPTLTFLLSIFLWKQDININQLIAFIGIWLSMALYVLAVRQEEATEQ